MAEKTLQDVLDGLYAEGHDKEAVRQALLAKYGVDPAQLDPRTPYGHIQAAAPRLKELLGHTPVEVFVGGLLGMAVAFFTFR